MIEGATAIRDAYLDDTLARRYVADRFTQPLGALPHARHVRAVERVIATARPERILEIGPGPARVTADVRHTSATLFLLDSSAAMLREARRRLTGITCRYLQGDVFDLPVQSAFDLVYSFRLIRHFAADDRKRIYAQIARSLRPGGWLVFDAVNEIVSAPLRARSGSEAHQHYDALLRPDVLRAELEAAGFEVLGLEGVQHRYALLYALQTFVAPRSALVARIAMEAVDRLLGGEPLEWIVICRRRS